MIDANKINNLIEGLTKAIETEYPNNTNADRRYVLLMNLRHTLCDIKSGWISDDVKTVRVRNLDGMVKYYTRDELADFTEKLLQ